MEDHTASAGSGTIDPADLSATVCQTRGYGFDVNGNRTSLTRTGDAGGGMCATSGGSTTTWSYDTADRLTGGYSYDALSRATTVPAADTPNGSGSSDVTLGYYNTDAIASITQDGTTTSYTLDPAGRRSVSTSVTGSTTNQTVTRHYTDASDNPGWVTTVIGSTSTTTRYAESIGGDLAATITDNGTTTSVNLPVVDPHGDVVTSIDIPASGDPSGITAWIDTDEYGNPLTTAAGATPTSGTGIGYGWVGGKQRATTDTGLLLMGARVYNPVTAQFTSIDPVFGGNPTAFGYPLDPINGYDLNGQWGCSWCSKAWDKTKSFVSSHSNTIAFGASVIAYVATGPVGWVAGSIAVGITAYSAYQNVKHKRYGAAAVDIISLGMGGSAGLFGRAARMSNLAGRAGYFSRMQRGYQFVGLLWGNAAYANEVYPSRRRR